MRFRQAIKICFLTCFTATFTSLKGQEVKTINLESLAQRWEKGKDTTYVLNFWATWCGPCVEELPYFDRLGERYAGQPLKVILVSLDFKSKLEKEVIPFVKKHRLKSEVYINEQNDEKFIDGVDPTWSGAIPATLIINRQNSIRQFYEKEFTFEELEKLYLEIKNKQVKSK